MLLVPLQRLGHLLKLGPHSELCGHCSEMSLEAGHTVEVAVSTGDARDTLLLPQRVQARLAVTCLVIPPGALLLCSRGGRSRRVSGSGGAYLTPGRVSIRESQHFYSASWETSPSRGAMRIFVFEYPELTQGPLEFVGGTLG